jgi:hypothetical protein
MNIRRSSGPGVPPSMGGQDTSAPGEPGWPSATAAPGATGSRGPRPGNAALATEAQNQYLGRFKGVLFLAGNYSTTMRRGPTPRMPLRSPSGKRGVGRSKPAAGGATEENEVDHAEESTASEALQLLGMRIGTQSQQDGSEQESNQGRQEERRFERLFQMAATTSRPSAQAAADARVKATGVGGRAPAAAAALQPLPPMHTLDDVVRVVQAATQADPTGKSVAVLLRRINAAVLRDEIRLPAVTRIGETRAALIDAFGGAARRHEPADDSLRAVHAMLPLWLINLSRPRTALGRAQAAARLSLPRNWPQVG